MAENNNAVCAICGKDYYLCMSCKDKLAAAPWKIHCCSAEHYKIYQILHGNTVGVYTNAEAKKKLKHVDLSDLGELRENKQIRIKELLGVVDEPADEAVVESKPTVDEKIVVETIVKDTANVIEEIVEAKEVPTSNFVARRKRK